MVGIVLPSYNGIKYIEQQINSILRQTYKNWHLYIRDDCSNDGTSDIIMRYKERYSKKITVIQDNKGNLGVAANVFEIIGYTSEDYIMLADQDDVWFKNKIEFQLKEMLKMEKENSDIPLLFCTNAVVTDKNLKVLYKSFFKCAFYDKTCNKLPNLLQRNIIQGASSIMNRHLINKLNNAILCGNTKIIMHDYWIALVASTFGKTEISDKTLMYYRQHEKNLVGALNYRGKIDYLLIIQILSSILYVTVDNQIAKEFFRVYKNELSKQQVKIIKAYLSLKKYRFNYLRDRLYRYDPNYVRVAKVLIGVHQK